MSHATDLAFIELNMNGYGSRGVELARRQGLRSRLVCRTPAEYDRLRVNPAELVDGVDVVDTYDVSHLLRHLTRLRPAALVAYDDYRLVQAALVARQLGLPGPDPQGVLQARFKDLTRRGTRGVGYEVAHAVVSNDGSTRTSPVGYPCVVKPVDDSASTGVTICHDDTEFGQAVATAVEHGTHARGYRCVDAVLVEEFIDGPEYSAELLWDSCRSDWHLLGFAETIPGPPPHCQEAAHVFPAPLDPVLAARLEGVVRRWLAAIGHRGTAAHVEFRLTASGEPALMEINPRLGGGEIRRLIEATFGIDVIDLYQDLWRGVGTDLAGSTTGGRHYTVIRYLNPPVRGRVRRVVPDSRADGVLASQMVTLGRAGLDVSPLSRLGWVIMRDEDRDRAVRATLDYHERTRFEYEP